MDTQQELERLAAENAALREDSRQALISYAALRRQLLDTQAQLADAQSRISGLRAKLSAVMGDK
mgnify:CR=1 FL=1